MRSTDRPRVLVYSHDTYGLGHLRRCLALAGALGSCPSAPTVLIATGSPQATSFSLPQGCDTLKLPAITKGPTGYRSRTLQVSLAESVELRSALLNATIGSFAPDVLLVDHAPLGMAGELTPVLDRLSGNARRPALVLGLRDVIDEAERVHDEWTATGAWSAVLGGYDEVLVYGDPALTTTAHELGLHRRLGERLRFTGYLGRPVRPAPPSGPRPPVVVAAGGGGDGHRLLRAYASYLESLPEPAPFRSIVVTGPLASPRRAADLEARFAAVGSEVEVIRFTNRFEDLLAEAAGVVTMAGYNTAVEILSTGVPALLYPRVAPRREQAIRAERLGAAAGLEVCLPGDGEVERIGRFVERVAASPFRRPPAVRLDGLRTAARAIERLAIEGPAASAARRDARLG